jgi:hypothetical protein
VQQKLFQKLWGFLKRKIRQWKSRHRLSQGRDQGEAPSLLRLGLIRSFEDADVEHHHCESNSQERDVVCDQELDQSRGLKSRDCRLHLVIIHDMILDLDNNIGWESSAESSRILRPMRGTDVGLWV